MKANTAAICGPESSHRNLWPKVFLAPTTQFGRLSRDLARAGKLGEARTYVLSAPHTHEANTMGIWHAAQGSTWR
jgi:hypothetical protein